MAVQFKISAENGVPVLKNIARDKFPDDTEVQSYITEAATRRGIDPKVASEVWNREGRSSWQSKAMKKGRREPSYGPFQLLVGGAGTGFPEGLGNAFKKETGLDPADPANWKSTIDYALDSATKRGWGAWYGARAAGITGFEGIAGKPSSFTAGGANIPNPQAAAPEPGLSGISSPLPPKPTRDYLWGGTSEAVSPSDASLMAPSFKREENRRKGLITNFGDMTIMPDLTGVG